MVMMKSLCAVAAATALVACVQQDEPPAGIARAIPTADQVKIKLPVTSERTVGQLAEFYVATRGVTLTFNGSAAWVLVLIHSIVQLPVTSVNGNVYTWGPGSDPLDPADYKLDVTDVGDGTYLWALSGRSKTQSNAQFETVIDGVADSRAGELQGNGSFRIDFDAGRRINPIDSGDARGKVDVSYDLAARHLELDIDSTDDQGRPVSAHYEYNETANRDGDMTFTVDADAGGTTAVLEELTLRSRWLATGEGRGDARITGGDCGTTTVVASECWDNRFGRVFYTDSVNFAPTEGNAAQCAFANQDLPPAN